MAEDEAKAYLTGESKEETSLSSQSSPSESAADVSDNINKEESIPLIAENLEIKKSIEEERIKIIKEPLRETKTVELQLMHEEISVERRPSASDSSVMTHGPVQSKTETIILLKREEPVIKKTPYVKEEIVIRKNPITETRRISEQVTSEKITTNKETL